MNIITRGFGADQLIVTQGYGTTGIVSQDLYFRGDISINDPFIARIGYE